MIELTHSLLLDGFLTWAGQTDVPNGIFLLALLTAPARWTKLANETLERFEKKRGS